MDLDRHPTKVLSIVDNRRCVIHEVGVWNTGVPRYTRWAFKDYVDLPRWMDETDVIFDQLTPEASVSLTSEVSTGDYTQIINKRYSIYTELYSAGDFKGLAKQLYTAEAV